MRYIKGRNGGRRMERMRKCGGEKEINSRRINKKISEKVDK